MAFSVKKATRIKVIMASLLICFSFLPHVNVLGILYHLTPLKGVSIPATILKIYVFVNMDETNERLFVTMV
jgi:hypothetical protein